MADINEQVSLGIGSPSGVRSFLTFGLQIAEAVADVDALDVKDAVPSGTIARNNGFLYADDADESLYVADGGTISHHNNGYPFNTDERLVVDSTGAVDRVVMGVPYTAAGRVAVEEAAIDRVLNGWPITANGKIAVAFN